MSDFYACNTQHTLVTDFLPAAASFGDLWEFSSIDNGQKKGRSSFLTLPGAACVIFTATWWSSQEHPHLTDERNQGADDLSSFPRDVHLCGKTRMWTWVCPLQSGLQPLHPGVLQWLQPHYSGLGQGCLSGHWAHRPSVTALPASGNEISRKTSHSWPPGEGKSRPNPWEQAVGSLPEQGRPACPLSITPLIFTPKDPHSGLLCF